MRYENMLNEVRACYNGLISEGWEEGDAACEATTQTLDRLTMPEHVTLASSVRSLEIAPDYLSQYIDNAEKVSFEDLAYWSLRYLCEKSLGNVS